MYSKEFYSILESANREINDARLKMVTVHPYDIINNNDEVLTEAFLNQNRIVAAIDKIIQAIQKATEKFIKITNQLDIRNRALVDKYEKVKVNNLKLDDFEHEMFPYWQGMRNIESYRTPNFDEKDINNLITNGGIPFKQDTSNFPQGLFDEKNGFSVNSNYFRGSGEKIKIDKNDVQRAFAECLKIIKERKRIVSKITSENRNIIAVKRETRNIKTEQITESVILDRSIFKDEYYDILFEDAVTTTTDLEREEKNGGKIESNSAENRNARSKDDMMNAVKQYVAICYDVNSKIMSVLDEAYDQSIKFCEKVSNIH